MRMLEQIVKYIFSFFFFCNDIVAGFLVKHIRQIKVLLLLLAHLSLFGFFFPNARREFGEMAANLLILILFVGPLAKIFPMRLLALLVSLRRELGILMGYLATVHGLGYMLDPQWFSLVIAPYWLKNWFDINPAILFGILAYGLTLPLLFTSNTFMLRILGGVQWKRLHRLAYVLFIVIVVHRFFMKGMRVDVVLAMAQAMLLILAYLFVKILAWKNNFSPLRALIALIEGRYKQYSNTNLV